MAFRHTVSDLSWNTNSGTSITSIRFFCSMALSAMHMVLSAMHGARYHAFRGLGLTYEPKLVVAIV